MRKGCWLPKLQDWILPRRSVAFAPYALVRSRLQSIGSKSYKRSQWEDKQISSKVVERGGCLRSNRLLLDRSHSPMGHNLKLCSCIPLFDIRLALVLHASIAGPAFAPVCLTLALLFQS